MPPAPLYVIFSGTQRPHRVLHTNKEFLKSWQYTVHKGYTTPDYPVDKALATTEKPLPA